MPQRYPPASGGLLHPPPWMGLAGHRQGAGPNTPPLGPPTFGAGNSKVIRSEHPGRPRSLGTFSAVPTNSRRQDRRKDRRESSLLSKACRCIWSGASPRSCVTRTRPLHPLARGGSVARFPSSHGSTVRPWQLATSFRIDVGGGSSRHPRIARTATGWARNSASSAIQPAGGTEAGT